MPDPTAERSYTTRVLVATVAVGVLTFAVPMIVMMVVMVQSFASGGFVRVADARSAEVFQGSLHYVSLLGGSKKPLWRSKLGSDDAELAESSRAQSPWLVATDSELWLFGRDSVERFDGARLEPMGRSPTLLFARPFVYEGRPAVLDVGGAGMMLSTWTGTDWLERAQIVCNCAYLPQTNLRAVASGKDLDLVVLDGTEVRHRRVKAGDDAGDPSTWSTVTRAASRVEVAPLAAGSFAVAAARTIGPRKTEVELWRGTGSGFTRLGTETLETPISSWGLTSDPGSDRALLVSMGGIQGDLEVLPLSGSGPAKRNYPAAGSSVFALALWPNAISLSLGLVLSFSLAGLLSRWVRALRGDEYTHDEEKVELASFTRRGLAQLADSVVQSLPFLVVAVLLVTGSFEWRKLIAPPYGPLWIIALSFGSLIWGFGSLGLMAACEWRWGKTPGKWLFGLRTIGVDLQPVGFGRALVRNLAEYADAMFMFSVGLAVAALSKNRQRLGDHAARTIVIRDRGGLRSGSARARDPA